MTAARTQIIERHYFERFRTAYPLPIGQIGYGDKPDITLTGERAIGIELTRFYLKPGSLLESTQRQRPLRNDVVAQAQALYRSQGGKAVELRISFATPYPITITRRRFRELVQELAALAKRIDDRPSGQVDRAEFQSIPEVSFVYLNKREYSDAKWRVGGVHGVGLMSAKALEDIVRAKEAKSTDYAPHDAYWLLVVVEAMDPAQEQEIRIDDLQISSHVFEKIIVYEPLSGRIIEAKPHTPS
jgi:hypothetical protein